MATVVACDLDQTLIFGPRSLRLAPEEAPPPLAVVETIDAAPAAFSTRRSLELLAVVAHAATLVPVTTRTLAQYARVDLGLRPPYAITANGGMLLVDGVPDAEWSASARARIAASARPLARIRELAEGLAAQGWARVTRVADDLFVYLVAHAREGIPDLSDLARSLAEDGWLLSVQGRKVYLVPAVLTKEAAVAEVMRRAGASGLVAAGDSVLDAGMLARADVAVRPAHGELHDRGWTVPGLRITAAAGVRAGEEICAALAAAVAAPSYRSNAPG